MTLRFAEITHGIGVMHENGGRETAKMLQFKINPVQLFDAK